MRCDSMLCYKHTTLRHNPNDEDYDMQAKDMWENSRMSLVS